MTAQEAREYTTNRLKVISKGQVWDLRFAMYHAAHEGFSNIIVPSHCCTDAIEEGLKSDGYEVTEYPLDPKARGPRQTVIEW